jgi:predicted dehydrogenase
VSGESRQSTVLTPASLRAGAGEAKGSRLPRLGFLGVGWIGQMRMEAVLESGAAAALAIADTSEARLSEAADTVRDSSLHCGPDCLEALIDEAPDGIVIATPSALHAEQAVAALEAGIPVFCQKPLGRDAGETRAVIEAARAADRLLGVDLSYRWVRGARRMRELVRGGAIGRVYAADLVFHNAYGPDKPWFYDARQSGGGCLMDLGVHLVDLALWMLDFPQVTGVSGRLFAGGRPLERRGGGRRSGDSAAASSDGDVEDFASARVDMEGGASASVSCSWNLSAGCDAVIGATFYGTDGTVSLRNVEGSFYDFRAEWYKGRETHLLDAPPDAWGGRALTSWARALGNSPAYDPRVEQAIAVAEVLDAVYSPAGRGGHGRPE